MSVAASIPCIRLPNSSTSSSSSSSSSLSSSAFRFSPSKSFLTIRSSQTEGPLRRPVSPSLREPLKPPSPLSPPPPPPPKPVAVEEDLKGGVTLEYQRQKAKELQQYFKQKKLEEATDQGPTFGWLSKNEINNGRWAMFGFAVGMLTEYATGSNFVVQMKILLSNFGIVDLE